MLKKLLKWLAIILFCIFSIDIVIGILNIGLYISEYIPASLHRVFIDKSRVLEITEYLELWFSVLSIIVTAVLSWLLLKVSKKSNEISEKISVLEESRDAQLSNDNIALVYYQIVHSFKELHKLYINYFILNKGDYCQIKVHSDWISALSKLQSVLSISEIDKIYQLFVDIESVNDSKSNQKLVVGNIYRKYVMSCFVDARNFLDLQRIDPLTMLHPEMISIIMFLLFSFKKKDLLIEKKKSKYIISETDHNGFNGEIELSKDKFKGNIKLTYNNLNLSGFFSENRFLSGTVKAYYDNTWYNLHEIEYKSNGDFHAKLYDIKESSCTGNLILDAEYKSNTFDVGFLILKKGEELWKGVVKYSENNFEMINGTIYHRLVEDSTREYNYDANEKWIEEELERQNDPEYIKSLANEGINRPPVGYKVYEDFVYENGKIIRRENTTKDNKYTYL